MKLLIAYGSLGKLFHLQEFSDALKKENVQVKLVKEYDSAEHGYNYHVKKFKNDYEYFDKK